MFVTFSSRDSKDCIRSPVVVEVLRYAILIGCSEHHEVWALVGIRTQDCSIYWQEDCHLALRD